jgi:hypothetical protein
MGECTSNSIIFVPLSMGDFFDELNDQMRVLCWGGIGIDMRWSLRKESCVSFLDGNASI